MPTQFVDVGKVEDINEGVALPVVAAGREIIVVLWRGQVYALRNICPHQSQSFITGTIHDLVMRGDSVGDLVVKRDAPVIKCPWHSFQFDLRSGKCVNDVRLRTRAYNVAIRGDRILVEMVVDKVGSTE